MKASLWISLGTVCAALAAPALAGDGVHVTGTVGRFYTGSTTGWEGSLLVDPANRPPSHAPAPGEDCDRLSLNYGATRGVELNEAAAHYTEAEVALNAIDGCQGIGIPIAGLSVGAGVRDRGKQYAGDQLTVSFFTLPWPFIQFYGRRTWRDSSERAAKAQFGLMFKIPIPVSGYDFSQVLGNVETEPNL